MSSFSALPKSLGSSWLSSLSFPIIVPPATAITSPTITYATAILNPKILVRSTSEPKSTSGEEIRNENVIPSGKPAFVKPIKIGIEEHEQKGVTVPRSAERIFPDIPLYFDSICFVRSGGKYV